MLCKLFDCVLSMVQTVKGNDGFSDRGINTFNDLPKNKVVQTEHIQHRNASVFASVCDLYDTYAAMQGLYIARAGGKTPRIPWSGGGLTYAQGPYVTYGKNFLSACRCITIVVL